MDPAVREAWRQATYAGLIVRGYQPTEQDKRQFVRDLAKARSPQEPPEPLLDPPPPVTGPPHREMLAPAKLTEREVDPEREQPLMASDRRGARAHRADPTPVVSNPAPEDARSEMRRETRRGSQRSRFYSGRLIEHGEARYKFSDDKEPSYFVRLETADGPKDLWGVDFPRALNRAGVREGDLIEVEASGQRSNAGGATAPTARSRTCTQSGPRLELRILQCPQTLMSRRISTTSSWCGSMHTPAHCASPVATCSRSRAVMNCAGGMSERSASCASV
jgi:hypothetical protein